MDHLHRNRSSLRKSPFIENNFPCETHFSRYAQSVLNKVCYFAVSPHSIRKYKDDTYSIEASSVSANFCFYVTLANSILKVVYITYLYLTQFSSMEFLDKMSVALYFLVFGIMTISYSIWFLPFPLFEIFHRFWSVEQKIFDNLESPSELQENVDKQHKATVWVHLAITWIGCICFIIQYDADPKYYTFTYAFFQEDTSILKAIFGSHEFLFMLHAWNLMTGSNALFTFQAIALTNMIDKMTEAVNRLSTEPERIQESSEKFESSGSNEKNKITIKVSHYTIDKILFDYKQLMIITELYNDWVSYKTIFLHGCGYCQFISDVFLAVQILRLPHTGIMDIWFYIEDSLASMYMIYRVYNNISRVEPASRNFFNAIDDFLRHPNSKRKYLSKMIKTLKVISMKIGPCPVTRSTVLSAMEILGNYYICVALW